LLWLLIAADGMRFFCFSLFIEFDNKEVGLCFVGGGFCLAKENLEKSLNLENALGDPDVVCVCEAGWTGTPDAVELTEVDGR
jgi:hypothetical protein